MLRRVLWFLIPLVSTGMLVWLFWGLGSLPDMVATTMQLSVEHPQVEIRRAMQEEWIVATGTMMLVPGDAVRTGPEGRATVQMFETSEHRLAGATEFMIDREGTADWSGRSVIRLRVERGRVWSRVLRLLDLRSVVQIQTNRVVATVRGTAFDLDAASTSTWIHVMHGAVTILPENASSSTVVADDERMMFDTKGVHHVSFASSTAVVSPWVQENILQDEKFVTRIETEREKRLAALGEIHPDQLRDRLTLFSERFHMLMVSDEEARALYARYVTRRLYAVKKMIDGQMLGGASQVLSSIEDSIARYMKGVPEDRAGAELLVTGMDEVGFLVERTTPESSLYRLKQRLEDMRLAVFVRGSAAFLYTRLLTIEARLNETAVFIERGDLRAAAQEIEAAHQGILNMEPDVNEEVAMGNVSQLDRGMLIEKLAALQARERSLRKMISLRSVMVPVSPVISTPLPEISSSSSTPSLTSTSTPSMATSSLSEVVPVPSSTPPLSPAVVTSSVVTLVAVQMGSTPSVLGSGTQTSLMAQAVYSDGTTKDVTPTVRWTSSNVRLGFFVGPVFYASAPGTVTLTAVYTEGRSSKTVSRDILITP